MSVCVYECMCMCVCVLVCSYAQYLWNIFFDYNDRDAHNKCYQ